MDFPQASTSKTSGDDAQYKNFSGFKPISPSNYNPFFFPIVKEENMKQVLPAYTEVLNKPPEEVVSMETLNKLQGNLETLLSMTVVRRRRLQMQIDSAGAVKKWQKYKKKKSAEDKESKRRLYKNLKSGSPRKKRNKKNYKREDYDPSEEACNKFWSFTEPYCRDVTKNDIKVLDGLIEESSQPIDLSIPKARNDRPVQPNNFLGKPIDANFDQPIDVPPNSQFFSLMDKYCGPLTQRLMSGLIEEKIPEIPTATSSSNLNTSDFSFPDLDVSENDVTLDDRLKEVLVEQGILGQVDLQQKDKPTIEDELDKCMQELKLVSDNNLLELYKLKTAAILDTKRQKVKGTLDKVDRKVVNVHKNINTMRENNIFTNKAHSEYKEAEMVIEEQAKLTADVTKHDKRNYLL